MKNAVALGARHAAHLFPAPVVTALAVAPVIVAVEDLTREGPPDPRGLAPRVVEEASSCAASGFGWKIGAGTALAVAPWSIPALILGGVLGAYFGGVLGREAGAFLTGREP